ncbi:MAG: C39 family peptidase [Verrucomicrobiota bacterium]
MDPCFDWCVPDFYTEWSYDDYWSDLDAEFDGYYDSGETNEFSYIDADGLNYVVTDWDGDGIFAGYPEFESYWQNYQGYENSCAIEAQRSVIESVLEQHIDHLDLADFAERSGWYDPDGGTPVEHMGRLLEHFEIPHSFHNNTSITDLVEALESGQRVIVPINCNETRTPLYDGYGDPVQQETAGHAIVVTGIVEDQGKICVVVNDSAYENSGAGMTIPIEHFLNAWEDYNRTAIITNLA